MEDWEDHSNNHTSEKIQHIGHNIDEKTGPAKFEAASRP